MNEPRSVWTPADEAKLVELQMRKKRIMEERLEPLLALMSLMPGEWDEDAMSKFFVENATELRAALEPFGVS